MLWWTATRNFLAWGGRATAAKVGEAGAVGALGGRPDASPGLQAVAVPTLIKKLPVPLRLLVGDLSRTEQVLQGLGLVARPS